MEEIRIRHADPDTGWGIPPISGADATRARVRLTALAVPTVAFFAGAAAGVRDPRWALLAAAVVFGWSQLAGA